MRENVWALVENGLVFNTIMWDGVTEVDFGKHYQVIDISSAENSQVSTGWIYKDGKFSPPPLTQQEEEEREKSKAEVNVLLKKSLFNAATLNIAVLQDAVDFEMATDEELRLLPLWKKYRVLLNRIDANTSADIKWPEEPK